MKIGRQNIKILFWKEWGQAVSSFLDIYKSEPDIYIGFSQTIRLQWSLLGQALVPGIRSKTYLVQGRRTNNLFMPHSKMRNWVFMQQYFFTLSCNELKAHFHSYHPPLNTRSRLNMAYHILLNTDKAFTASSPWEETFYLKSIGDQQYGKIWFTQLKLPISEDRNLHICWNIRNIEVFFIMRIFQYLLKFFLGLCYLTEIWNIYLWKNQDWFKKKRHVKIHTVTHSHNSSSIVVKTAERSLASEQRHRGWFLNF